MARRTTGRLLTACAVAALLWLAASTAQAGLELDAELEQSIVSEAGEPDSLLATAIALDLEAQLSRRGRVAFELVASPTETSPETQDYRAEIEAYELEWSLGPIALFGGRGSRAVTTEWELGPLPGLAVADSLASDPRGLVGVRGGTEGYALELAVESESGRLRALGLRGDGSWETRLARFEYRAHTRFSPGSGAEGLEVSFGIRSELEVGDGLTALPLLEVARVGGGPYMRGGLELASNRWSAGAAIEDGGTGRATEASFGRRIGAVQAVLGWRRQRDGDGRTTSVGFAIRGSW